MNHWAYAGDEDFQYVRILCNVGPNSQFVNARQLAVYFDFVTDEDDISDVNCQSCLALLAANAPNHFDPWKIYRHCLWWRNHALTESIS